MTPPSTPIDWGAVGALVAALGVIITCGRIIHVSGQNRQRLEHIFAKVDDMDSKLGNELQKVQSEANADRQERIKLEGRITSLEHEFTNWRQESQRLRDEWSQWRNSITEKLSAALAILQEIKDHRS